MATVLSCKPENTFGSQSGTSPLKASEQLSEKAAMEEKVKKMLIVTTKMLNLTIAGSAYEKNFNDATLGMNFENAAAGSFDALSKLGAVEPELSVAIMTSLYLVVISSYNYSNKGFRIIAQRRMIKSSMLVNEFINKASEVVPGLPELNELKENINAFRLKAGWYY